MAAQPGASAERDVRLRMAAPMASIGIVSVATLSVWSVAVAARFLHGRHVRPNNASA